MLPTPIVFWHRHVTPTAAEMSPMEKVGPGGTIYTVLGPKKSATVVRKCKERSVFHIFMQNVDTRPPSPSPRRSSTASLSYKSKVTRGPSLRPVNDPGHRPTSVRVLYTTTIQERERARGIVPHWRRQCWFAARDVLYMYI